MKVCIVYASVHHQNTKKVIDAIYSAFTVTLIDAVREKDRDINEFDVIGFASGIYFSKFHKAVLELAEKIDVGKRVFFISTYGGSASYKSIESVVNKKNALIIGSFGCKGFDTYGPFKLIGGVSKGHPNEEDLKNALDFYNSLNLNE